MLAVVYLESLHCAVVWVHHELGERGELRGPVPAITAVDQHISSLQLQTPGNHSGSLYEV